MTDRIRTPLCDLLGIRVPVVLGPMAGGPNGPELVAAVTRAGGLGMFGVTGMTAAAVHDEVTQALALCEGPVGVNVQLAAAAQGSGTPGEVAAALAPLRAELGLAGPGPGAHADPPLALVEAALDAGAGVLSSALGDPAPLVPMARAAGVPLLAMVTTVDEARRSAAAGADAVVAQGAEAGGHRGSFAADPDPPLVGGMALVPRVVDAVAVPVAAAGGIMDGRGLAAALMLGAQGVVMGTRFLLASEARVSDAYRHTLATLEDTGTLVTDAVTGRPARWVRNRVVEVLDAGPPHLGWGAQRAAVEDIRQEAARAGRGDLLPMLAGQGAGMTGAVMGAEEIVAAVVAEASALLA